MGGERGVAKKNTLSLCKSIGIQVIQIAIGGGKGENFFRYAFRKFLVIWQFVFISH